MTTYRILLLSLLISLFSLTQATAGTILPPPAKISDHVYVWIGPYEGPNKENRGYRMNLAFVVGSKAVAVIDTGYTPMMAEEMLRHIRTITSLPVKYAINTNSQPHRFMGNDVFKSAGAMLITSPQEKERMSKQAGQFTIAVENNLGLPKNSVKIPPLPTTLVKDKKSIDLGKLKIVIENFGVSHTPSSLTVHIAADNIVYAGDILYAHRLLSVLPDSKVKGWINTYNKLKKYGDVIFIPGHGEPAKLSAFDFSTLSYLTLLHSHMKKSVDDGLDSQDAIKSLNQGEYSKLALYDQLAGRNASWAYLEAEAASFE